jgi:hypothetical protein
LADFRRAPIGERRADFQFADDGARFAAQAQHRGRPRAGFHGIAVAARGAAAIHAVLHSGHSFSLRLFVDSSSSSL